MHPSRTSQPLWQRDWLHAYPPGVPSSLAYPPIPVSGLLEEAALRFSDRPGCTILGRSMTFGELAQQARRLARSLADLGAGPGQCVGMLLPNIPEYIVALQATWLTGATVLQFSPLMVADELRKWIEATGCRIVVTLDLLAPTLLEARAAPLEHVIVTSLAPRFAPWKGWLYSVERLRRHGPFRLRDDGLVQRFEQLLRGSPRPLLRRIVPEEDVAVLAPTGGTTASPKAVMLTHRNLVANAYQVFAWSRNPPGEAQVLGVLPFFHAYGLTVGLLASLVGGWTVHLHPRFEAGPVLDLLERYRIDTVPAVPAMLAAMNRELRQRPRDLSFIRTVVSGASALPSAVREEFAQSGARLVVEGYGLTEAGPVTHVNPLDGHHRPGTIGLPLPDTDARIVDQATGVEELPVGSVGELVVRGPQVMKGYYNNPAETARALRHGWLYTGDLARRDRDGFFTIVDRKKDIIKTSGFLVYPAEVEEVLARCPGVAEAAVVGVPDPERGEIVKAIVVAKPGIQLDLAALERYAAEHLGKQKRPQQYEVVAQLPKNFLGKVQRRRLREAEAGAPSR
ncbi:MAG: AMP-binding protein [Gemmataceae bacterium]|nr:AMP-binding protein [Gemmataceae bacterium]MDW8265277.1 AMP-binding protein [Gemmataceae bacterium]